MLAEAEQVLEGHRLVQSFHAWQVRRPKSFIEANQEVARWQSFTLAKLLAALPKGSARGLHQDRALWANFPLDFYFLGAKFLHSLVKFLTCHLPLTPLTEESLGSPEVLALCY